MKKEDFFEKPLIKIFVYGTLRKGQRLGFYLNKEKFSGKYYTQGQLMKAQNGSVYIDFAYNNVVTIGEMYYIDFYCLQRINHLEVFSGVFPQGYDLNVIPIWEIPDNKEYSFSNKTKEWAFFFKRRNDPIKILTGDFADDFQPIDVLREMLLKQEKDLKPEVIIKNMQDKLSIFESFIF